MGYNGNTQSDKKNGQMHGFSVKKNKVPHRYTCLVLNPQRVQVTVVTAVKRAKGS